MDQALLKNTPLEAIRETTIQIEDTIKKKLPREYHDLVDIFNRNKVKKLPPY